VVETTRSGSPYASRRADRNARRRASREPPASFGRDARCGRKRRASSRREQFKRTKVPLSTTSFSLRGSTKVPPPSAITAPPLRAARASAARSWRRNAASPRRANISATDIPADFTISASRSANGRRSFFASAGPTVDLPVPMKPVRYTFFTASTP